MTWADAVASRAVQDGLLAERKLRGDPDIIATDDREELQRIISQGKRCEGTLRKHGKEDWIKMAYARAGVKYIGEERCHDGE